MEAVVLVAAADLDHGDAERGRGDEQQAEPGDPLQNHVVTLRIFVTTICRSSGPLRGASDPVDPARPTRSRGPTVWNPTGAADHHHERVAAVVELQANGLSHRQHRERDELALQVALLGVGVLDAVQQVRPHPLGAQAITERAVDPAEGPPSTALCALERDDRRHGGDGMETRAHRQRRGNQRLTWTEKDPQMSDADAADGPYRRPSVGRLRQVPVRSDRSRRRAMLTS